MCQTILLPQYQRMVLEQDHYSATSLYTNNFQWVKDVFTLTVNYAFCKEITIHTGVY